MLQVGRQTRIIRTQVLLQPYTYGVADRSTGPMIDCSLLSVIRLFMTVPFRVL